jgi:hypothetical protein
MLSSDHSIVIYALCRCQWTPHLLHFGNYWGIYGYSNLGSFGSHSWSLLSQDIALLKLPYLLAHTFDWGLLEHLELIRHKLLIAHGLNLVTPSLCGCEVFSTPEALTHTRITLALSPMVPQVLDVTPGSPFFPKCFKHLLMKMCATLSYASYF